MAKDLRDRKNILVGAPEVKASGGVLIGKVATGSEDVPTNALGELPTVLAAAPAGYISQDGLTKTVDRKTDKIKDWNGDTIIVLTSEHSIMLKLTFMEAANANILKSIYGDENVHVSGQSIKITENSADLPHNSYAFEIKGAEDARIRVFAPDAQVSSVGDVTFVKNDVIKYEVELECFTDSKNNKLYQFIDRVLPTTTVTLPAGVRGGTFKVSIGGQSTTALQHNAEASAVRAALRAVAGGEAAEVTGAAGGPYIIGGVTGVITADGASLTGGSTTITVA